MLNTDRMTRTSEVFHLLKRTKPNLVISSPLHSGSLETMFLKKEVTAIVMLCYCCGESQVDLTGSILLNMSRPKDYNTFFLS